MVVGRGPAVPPWGLIPVFPHISEGACNLLSVFFSLVDAIWYGLFRGPGLLGWGDSSSPSRGWSFTYPSGHVVGIVEANPPVDPDCSNHSQEIEPKPKASLRRSRTFSKQTYVCSMVVSSSLTIDRAVAKSNPNHISVFFSCEGRVSVCFDSLDRIRPIFLSISSLIESI
jgi:hypothetical protein